MALDIDSVIDAITTGSPGTAMVTGGGYEASDKLSRELALWQPPVQGPDSDILPDKATGDARTLDLMRNDAFVMAGSQLHKDSVVGSMYTLVAKPKYKVLGLDETWATEFAEEVEEKFTLWAESPNNWIDASRRNTLTSMIRLLVGVYLHSGEVLLISEWLRENIHPYRTCFQAVELNRLCDPGTYNGMTRLTNQTRMRGGIELNSRGAPIFYNIRRTAPGVYNWDIPNAWSWARVRTHNSFGRPNVIHVMEQQRPGQSRGMSQLTAGLKEMRTLKRFRDVTLQRAILDASFAASIESELPTETVFEQMGSGTVNADAIVEYATDYLTAVLTYTDASRNMHIDGARIPHFFPGTKLNMNPMSSPGGIGSDFEKPLLRYLAANLDVSYEELSRDYAETNYSSARAGMLVTNRATKAKKKMVADRVAWTFYRNWFEEALGRGDLETMKGRRPNFYEGLNVEAYTNAEWLGASLGMIDELKETQAAILRIKAGISTFADELSRQGKDWRENFAQRKREKELMEELGIEIQEDNAINAASGEPGEPGDGTEEPERREENA